MIKINIEEHRRQEIETQYKEALLGWLNDRIVKADAYYLPEWDYYVENSDNLQKQIGLSGFQKQNAARINPLLAQFDISLLPTGNYNLVIETRDSTSVLQSQKKT